MSENKNKKLPADHLKYFTSDAKEYRTADMIIRYLQNPEDESVALSKIEKIKLDRYQEIYNLRLQYKRNKDIIPMIKLKYGVTERQVQMDIRETEYIFGTFKKANLEFERNFLLECSRKNIELAFASNNPKLISGALAVHSKIAGTDQDTSELPDFSKLEQHNYNIIVPPQFMNALLAIAGKGAVKLDDIIPPTYINIDQHQHGKED